MLLVSGCSFTESNYWSGKVGSHFNQPVYNLGFSMNGNSYIAKTIINEISNHFLYNERLVVGIMWSMVSRKEILINRKETIDWEFLTQEKFPKKFPENQYWYHMNINDSLFTKGYNSIEKIPTKSSDIDNIWIKSGGGVHFNSYSENSRASDRDFWRIWYSNYYTYEGSMWETLENILRVQWFLDKYKIPYFMTSVEDIFTEGISKYKNLNHLYKLIDFNKFCLYKETKGITEHNIENGYLLDEGHHPTKEGNVAFCNDIIIPHIEKNNLFGDN